MQPYNEDLVLQTNEKVKALYKEADEPIDEQYPVWVARTVYDYCGGMSWSASESKHLRECREALGLPLPVAPARTGRVRRAGRAMADDAGEYCALGASLFWAVWASRNNPAKLEANLQYLRSKGVDFVRILLSVGKQGGWSDRSINPNSPTWEADVRATLEAIRAAGLRAAVTILGDYPDNAEDVCRKAVRICESYPETIQYIEVCNESFANWLGGTARFIALTRELAGSTQFLVASSCAQKGALWNDVGTIGTAHLSRDCNTWHGHWRPVRQPWGYNAENEEDAQEFCVNNEPIGPDSSVESEKDPAKLAAHAAITYIAGMCAYVLHAGAGIRGGGAEDLAKGRKSDWMDEAEAAVALDSIAAIRSLLPKNLPNWGRQNSHWPGAPYSVNQIRENESDYGAIKVYSAVSGTRHVTCVIGVNNVVHLTSKNPGNVSAQLLDGTVTEIGKFSPAGTQHTLTKEQLVYGGF